MPYRAGAFRLVDWRAVSLTLRDLKATAFTKQYVLKRHSNVFEEDFHVALWSLEPWSMMVVGDIDVVRYGYVNIHTREGCRLE